MRKKVIIVTYKELENFEYEKYGGYIFEKYFDVEVWSVSKVFFETNIKTKDLYPKQTEIETIKEFAMRLRHYSRGRTFLFFIFPPTQRTVFYFEAVVSIMGFQYSMAYCQPYLSQWNSDSLKNYWKKRKPDYVNAILNAFFPPTFNFIAAPASYKEFPSVWGIRKQNNIMLHTLDYDVYLKIKEDGKRLIKEKYILFVDESYVAHYDYQIFGVNSPFKKPEDYYVPVRSFFDYIEQLFGYRVVIAEHPRAHYPDSSIYGNREMIRGQTARLVRDAEMVLCHTSTAIDYIILFQKKFLILYLDEIRQFYEWENYYIPLFNYLKIRGLNLSKPYNEDTIKSAVYSGSSNGCKKYNQHYIKAKGTREEPFFEIAAEYIRKALGQGEYINKGRILLGRKTTERR